MHKKNHSINQGSVSNFLAKFQGKINILSKFGEINHGDVVHLPVIKTNQSKRSNTFNFSNLSTKKSFSSVCSKIHPFENKTSFALKKSDLKLSQQKKQIRSQLRNRIVKPLEPIEINQKYILREKYEPFSATPPLKKNYTMIDNLDRINKKEAISKHIQNSFKQKRQKTDYSNFLRQLDIISNQGIRKSQIR